LGYLNFNFQDKFVIMDESVFRESAPGKLWEISVEGRKDWAFITDPLPDEWEISTDIWGLRSPIRRAES